MRERALGLCRRSLPAGPLKPGAPRGLPARRGFAGGHELPGDTFTVEGTLLPSAFPEPWPPPGHQAAQESQRVPLGSGDLVPRTRDGQVAPAPGLLGCRAPSAGQGAASLCGIFQKPSWKHRGRSLAGGGAPEACGPESRSLLAGPGWAPAPCPQPQASSPQRAPS